MSLNEKYTLSVKEVSEFISLSVSSIKRLIEIGDFVQGINITQNRIAYKRKDIEEWIDNREKKLDPEVSKKKRKIKCPQTLQEIDDALSNQITKLKSERQHYS